MEAVAIQELQPGSIRNWLSIVLFVMRNWVAGWLFFVPQFILSLAGMFTSATVFYLMGQLVAPGAQPHIAQYGQSYGAYIITGLMFNMLMRTTMTGYHESCLEAYWGNQFNTYMLYPGGISALLTGRMLVRYLMSGLEMLIYFLVGMWIFHVAVVASHLFDVAVIVLLAIAALTGLGLLGASTFTLLDAKQWNANPVEWLVGFGVTLLSGIYFPAAVLPGWLQRVGEWLPQTHALRAARLCLSGRAGLGDPRIAQDILFLLVFAMIAFPLGALLFAAGLRKAQRDGTLTRWS